jgi:hypothetical protein
MTNIISTRKTIFRITKWFKKFDEKHVLQEVAYNDFFETIQKYDHIINHLKFLESQMEKEGNDFEYENDINKRVIDTMNLREEYLKTHVPNYRIPNRKYSSLEESFEARNKNVKMDWLVNKTLKKQPNLDILVENKI